MANKLPEGTNLLIGREYPPADEDKYIQQMITDLQGQLKKLYPEGKTLRQTHPKMHGCVRAEFTILDNLDNDLKVGLFKEPKTYEAYIRFSNASTFIQADSKKDVRGIAIKLTNVPGEKLDDTQSDNNSQDFVMISNDIFFSRNVQEFHKVIHAFTSGKLSLGLFLLNPMHWPIASKLIKSNISCEHPMNIPYWSAVPYMFGKDRAVKYHVSPANDPPVSGSANKDDESYLRTNMVKTLSERDAFFDFFIQFQTDPNLMPVEDPTVRWTSPFIKVATIRIPKQVFDTEEQNHLGDGFSFSPWHSLKEHRPIGGLNRARQKVYYALSSFWHDRNDQYASKQ
jgi:hypothetical protein